MTEDRERVRKYFRERDISIHECMALCKDWGAG